MSHLCTNSWQKIWRSRYDFLFAALVSPGSVCRIHRPPTSKLHTIISCKGADALGTVRKQSHSLHVAVCQFDGYKKSMYRLKLFHIYLSKWKVFCLSALRDNTPTSFRQILHAPSCRGLVSGVSQKAIMKLLGSHQNIVWPIHHAIVSQS